MTKKVKIMFSALALTAVAGISVASVVSCTTSNNDSSSAKTSSNSDSTNKTLNTNQDIANALVTYFNQTTTKTELTESFQLMVKDVPAADASMMFSNASIKAELVTILTKGNTSSTTISYNGTSYTGSEYNTVDIEITNTKYDSTTKILTFDISYNNEASTLGALTYDLSSDVSSSIPTSQYVDVANAITTYLGSGDAKQMLTLSFSKMETEISTLSANGELSGTLTTIIQAYISSAKATVSYGSYSYTPSQYVVTDITVTSATYTSSSNELTFTISYANKSATSAITYTLTTTSSSSSDTSAIS